MGGRHSDACVHVERVQWVSTWGADKEDTLGDTCSHSCEALRALEELNDLGHKSGIRYTAVCHIDMMHAARCVLPRKSCLVQWQSINI